ncbi:MAG: NADH-quinone oxidoreductase subunit C [Armatimonadetes bacterium]|nr:NADH-quinone oxidoreductase subunit C [Armatimonadota bacterium]MDW8121966.1 NADH-quinone oxidoreductase subunit C [Armatimonadota bacterium]
MNDQELEQKIKENWGDGIVSLRPSLNGLEVRVTPNIFKEFARWLAADQEMEFNYLRCLSTVDWVQEQEIEVVYHLFSLRHRHHLVLKVRVPRKEPQLPTVSDIWATANWHEREAYDLMGVFFVGHPDLRRLFLPPGFEGHPLRKDYIHDIERFDDEFAEKIRRGEIQ